MIQSNELRIGNLIDRADYICVVTEISKEGLLTEPLNYKGERFINQKIKPISITEEILLKCGIVYGQPKEPYKEGLIYYDIQDKLLMITGTEYNEPISLIEAKYLHQVQNIVYWYTGKELTISL